MGDNNMIIIKLKKNEIKFIECFYGLDKKLVNTSNKVREYLNTCVKNKIFFISLKINNNTIGEDPVPGKSKIFNLHFKEIEIYNIKENKTIYFCIELSFNIVFKNTIDKIKLDKYNYATIFGKGDSFKLVDKKENELRCAINQAANIAKDVDFLCMNDHHNLFKIDIDTFKNLKYILIPEYLHVKRIYDVRGYFVNILDYLNDKFFGNLIIYNLITAPTKTKYIIDLNTAISSGNNCFEFISKYTNIKDIDIYGIGVPSKVNKNYNDIFVGNGDYTAHQLNIIKTLIKECSLEYKNKYKLN
jgi:hypothetical protein